MDPKNLDPNNLPWTDWVYGDKDSLKRSAMIQVIVVMLSWGVTADEQGTPLTEEDVVEILKNASQNYGPNKEDMDNGA